MRSSFFYGGHFLPAKSRFLQETVDGSLLHLERLYLSFGQDMKRDMWS